MKKTTLNPLTDKPENLTQVTKNFMLAYMQNVAPQDIEWFKKLCMENVKKEKNKLTGNEQDVIVIKDVRAKFVDRYFPNLANDKKNKSFLDLVNEL